MKPTTITIDDVQYVRADSVASKPAGPEVIIRTYSSGVHVGQLKHREGREVTLTNAKRIWSWSGAFTLNEISQTGLNRAKSRISKAVPEILLLEAIEVLSVASGVDLSPTEQ